MLAEGLLIGSANKPWRIGRLLGSGACGAVHELTAPPGTKSSTSPAYAIKIVPLPKSMSSGSKTGKKRKKTAEERNADLLLHEYTTLQNVPDMRGKIVPEIPIMNGPPAYGQTAGSEFRFLVMERMAAPLSEVIPILLDSHSKSKVEGVAKVPLGNVAVAMLNCIQSMHEKGFLFVDVKPENFMLSGTASTASSKRSKAANDVDVSQRVRLIDFGLVERWGDMSTSGHRENADGGAPLVGTPSYASLNVMSGHTVSLRDDLEALGYVISELILMLTSAPGSADKRKKKDDNVLPWSHAVSDDELQRIKSQEMDKSKRPKSKFFAALKAAGADTVMGNYFSDVQGLKYSDKPDYDSLRCYLKKLVVTVQCSGLTGGAKKKVGNLSKKATKASARQNARRKYEDSDSEESVEVIDENVENCKSVKKQKVSVAKESVARRSTRSTGNVPKTREMGTQTDILEAIDVDSSVDEDTMEWESIASADRDEPPNDDIQGKGILKLEVVEGPHKGQEIAFGGDHSDTVLIGGNPESRAMKDVAKFSLSGDSASSGVLVKVVLTSKKNLHSVRVTDMSSSSDGVLVKGSSLPMGKSRQAFVNDKIKIGDSLLHLRKF